MNDSKIKSKISGKSLKKFDEIIMDSIVGLSIYHKIDRNMIRRLTLATSKCRCKDKRNKKKNCKT